MNPPPHMFNSNIQPPYQTNLAYQQPQQLPYQQPPPPYQTPPRPYQPPPQQFGPRFQTPNQQHFTPPNQFYHPHKQHQDHQSPPYQLTTPSPQPFYPPSTPPGFDQVPKPPYQSPGQNYEPVPPNLPYPPPSGPNFNQAPISPPSGPNFHQAPVPPPLGPNFNQAPIPPPSGPNFNQAPIPPVYQSPGPMYQQPVQNYNRPPYAVPPQQNYNQMLSPQSPTHRFCQVPNNPYQGHGQRVEIPRYPQQQEPPYNLSGQEFIQSRPPYRPPGQQFRQPFRHQNARFGVPQNNFPKPQFHPRQQHHQNYRTNNPSSFNNQQNFISTPKKDKPQIACNKGDCDFVGHASAVREHQNMHHRFGLHKKVLYSNSSDAVKKWIEERKKKWPTKEIAQLKLEIEDEKNKRGERIADEDFHRFNNKNDKFNRNGNGGRFNNRKRPKFDGTYTEPPEEPMNGNLNRFSGIKEILIKEEAMKDEARKSGSLKLLEQYECSDNASDDDDDDDAPEEVAIIKESAPLKNDCSLSTEECDVQQSQNSMTIDDAERNLDNNLTTMDTNDTQENKKEDFASVNDKPEKIVKENNANDNEIRENGEVENSQKRKRPQKKDGKPVKKVPPPRTPRNEVMERKAALLEALMGNLMRSERNTITQCICYIRNNMDRFTKSQTA